MSDTNRTQQWRSRIAAAKSKRSELIAEWQENVNYRRGKPFETASDEDRVVVNLDWSQTKAKQAQLFSQVPEVRLTPKHPAFAPAVPVFAKLLNDTLTKAKVGAAMDEVLPDVINAAGVGAAIVAYEARTDTVEVPAIDPTAMPPEQMLVLLQSPEQVPTVSVPRTVDARFTITHISPEDLLVPVEFTGSDADDAPWIGRSGRMTWAEAKNAFSLKDEDRDEVTSNDSSKQERLVPESAFRSEEDLVSFDEIYYWRHRFHADEMHFKAIQRVVIVDGLDEPVIDEPWKGQQFDDQTGTYVGACRFPIRVLTLTHISGQFIPPSDSAMARPQVNELIRSRSQMILQRQHSLPVRWYDVDRVDPSVMDSLQRGTWQGIIPIQSNGSVAIGEVARSSFPQEDFAFDRVAKQDAAEMWQVGPNQMGTMASGERSASEANIAQSNFQTRIGYERARCAAFFTSIAEVLAGLLALYGDVDVLAAIDPQGAQRLQSWDRTRINGEFVYDVRPDSTVLLDVSQRIQRLTQFLNLTAKSGFVNVKPIVEELAALTGLDPAQVVVDPSPRPPDQLNVSIRNYEDVRDPIMLALLMKTGQAPSPQDLDAAKNLIASAGPAPVPHEGESPAATVAVGDAFPEWNTMSRVNTRRSSEEEGA